MGATVTQITTVIKNIWESFESLSQGILDTTHKNLSHHPSRQEGGAALKTS